MRIVAHVLPSARGLSLRSGPTQPRRPASVVRARHRPPCMGAAPLRLRGARPRQKGAAPARLPGGLRPARRCSGGVEAKSPPAAAWLRLRLTPAHCAGVAYASARRWWRWTLCLSAGRAPAINGLARLRCACAPGGRSGRSPQADGSRRGVDAQCHFRARALRLNGRARPGTPDVYGRTRPGALSLYGRARPGAPGLASLAAWWPSLLAFLAPPAVTPLPPLAAGYPLRWSRQG